MPDSDQLCLDNVLSFIQVNRDVKNKVDMRNIILGFYKPEEITAAKERICLPTATKRRGVNKSLAEIDDIFERFDEFDADPSGLPTYVCRGINSMPPSSGFEAVIATIQVLKSELTQLTNEVASLRNERDDLRTVIHNANTNNFNLLKRVNDLHDKVDKGGHPTSSNQKTFAQALQKPGVQTSHGSAMTVPPGPSRGPPTELTTAGSAHQRGMAHFTTQANGEDDRNQWRLVEPRNRRNGQQRTDASRRPMVVRGCRKLESSTLRGTLPLVDIFVGGWDKDTTVDNIKNYCTNELKIDYTECVPMVTKSERYNAFRIKLDLVTRDTIMNPDSWPEWVFVRKFYKPRRPTNLVHNTQQDVS